MFLLLVVQCHFADGILEADGNLAVVGNTLTGTLLILIETHLLLIDHTVHIVPRPAGTQPESDNLSISSVNNQHYAVKEVLCFWSNVFDRSNKLVLSKYEQLNSCQRLDFVFISVKCTSFMKKQRLKCNLALTRIELLVKIKN